MPLEDHQVYETIGEEGFRSLVSAFYKRVATDPILAPMYPRHDLAGAEARLLGFLTYRFGGPQTYIATRGHPRLRMRHAPFPIDVAAADRWFSLMSEALTEAAIDPAAAALLLKFFRETTIFLINRDEGGQ